MKRTKKILSAILALVIGLGCFTLAPAYAEDGADVYDTMRLKLYDMIVGADYDPAEEWTGPIIAAIDQKAREYWDSMNKNPVSNAINGSYRDDNDQLFGGDSSQDYLWADRPLGKRGTTSGCWYESNNIQWGFINLKSMALAYKTVGSELYGDEALLADIKMGVKFLYDNHFNPNVKNYGNWYGWELGCPLNFAEILVMLYDEFTPQEMEDYASMLTHYLGKKSSYTGANGLWAERVRMYAGILLKDSTWLDFVKTQLPKYYTYATGKDGYHTDGTFSLRRPGHGFLPGPGDHPGVLRPGQRRHLHRQHPADDE